MATTEKTKERIPLKLKCLTKKLAGLTKTANQFSEQPLPHPDLVWDVACVPWASSPVPKASLQGVF